MVRSVVAAAKTSLSKGLAAPESDVDLIFKLYRYLIKLPSMTIEENATDSTIIESESFLGDISVIITGKPMDHPANQNADDSNDVYAVDLSLVLNIAAKAENGDNLVLAIMNGDEIVAVGRVAGELDDGEQQLIFENGRCIVSDLTLQEGDTDNIRIAMSGTQNLSKGVYLFVSEVREVANASGETELVSSQSMVGVAEGARSVNAVSHFAFDLDVDDETAIEEMDVDESMDHAEGDLPDLASRAGSDERANQMEGVDLLNADDEAYGGERMAQAEELNRMDGRGNSTVPNDGAVPVIAQTGDESKLGMWGSLLFAGVAALVTAIACGKEGLQTGSNCHLLLTS